MTTTNPLSAPPTAKREPVLACVYKVLKTLDGALSDTNSSRNWVVLERTRKMIGQGPMAMDGVSYGEMRRFIRYFMEKWGLV